MNINKSIATAAVVLTLLVAACSGGGATNAPTATSGPTAPTDAPTATSAPTDTPSETATETASAAPSGAPTLVGNVDIHGSSTVYPISNAVAEDISAVSPEFSYFVGFEGTGAGFAEFFCVDGGDIADASRQMRASNPETEDDEEADICAANGVEWVELKIGYDGIAVITDLANPIQCLTFADLYALMGPESDNVANWQDAEPLAQQLGSTTDLPDAPLSITAPGDESGTYDSFVELALTDIVEAQFEGDDEAIDANLRLRTPGGIYVASGNDNAIIQGVGGTPNSLGFVGLAYALENAASVRILGVDGGDGCVAASHETVADGSYPISRPLFIYPNLGRAAANAAIVGYVDYSLSDVGIANVAETGYVELPLDELEVTRAAWDGARP